MKASTATRAANGWTREHIIHLLNTNDRAVERALLQIYLRQTHSEKVSMNTHIHNNRGFTAFDGELLTNIAEKFISTGKLTMGQLNIVRPKMTKYWKQLLEIASESTKSPTFDRPVIAKVKKQKQLNLIP